MDELKLNFKFDKLNCKFGEMDTLKNDFDVLDELNSKFAELDKLKDEFDELDKLYCKFVEVDKLKNEFSSYAYGLNQRIDPPRHKAFPTRSNTNWAVHLQKMARVLQFRIY